MKIKVAKWFTIHQAAAPDGITQKCALCGATLVDTSHQLSLGGERARFFQAGKSVHVDRSFTYVTERAPDCNSAEGRNEAS